MSGLYSNHGYAYSFESSDDDNFFDSSDDEEDEEAAVIVIFAAVAATVIMSSNYAQGPSIEETKKHKGLNDVLELQSADSSRSDVSIQSLDSTMDSQASCSSSWESGSRCTASSSSDECSE
jgi:hypothetical protein